MTCKKCKRSKPSSEFWKNEKRCKDCMRKKYKAWVQSPTGRVVRREISKRYSRSEKGKVANRKGAAAYRKRKPDVRWYTMREKLQARNAVGAAVKSGRLKKLPCKKCKNKNSQAHHEDYTKPLKVVWLCARHHTEIHRQQKEKEQWTKKN